MAADSTPAGRRGQIGGPAGLLLSEILHSHGVDSLVLERSSREHVLSRIRAGVLEQTTVDVLRAHGLTDRLDLEGQAHDGMKIVWAGRESYFIDVAKHAGKRFTTYGQTKIQEDLFAAADSRHANVLTEAEVVQLFDVTSKHPYVTFGHHGEPRRLDCEFIAGCDGSHGVSRQSIPPTVLREFEKVYRTLPTPTTHAASRSPRHAVRRSAVTTSRYRWTLASKTGPTSASGQN